MRRKKKLVAVVGCSLALLAFWASAAWSYDQHRTARRVKEWRSDQSSECCSSCSPTSWAADMVQSWLDEVVTHPGWTEQTYYYYDSKASHFFDDPEVSGGLDHTSYGLDNADAVMFGLHGNVESHNGKSAFRARNRSKFIGEPSEFCKAWLDYHDFGDDNNPLPDDNDLEWLHAVSCHSMDYQLVESAYSNTYHQWSDAFDGLNSASGYNGVVVGYAALGEDLAEDFFDNIEDSWLLNNYTTATTSCSEGGTGIKRCPVWITYDETTEDAVYTRDYDDYTTRVGEPPGHGGNNVRLRSHYSSCQPCENKQ